ncbi:MSCRAMM family adhesin SdrC [Halosolutus halophilus]|uniref:MSCRAMM family adhesin SdrC n=1 Tax=Halosolutus halophilus TaxID=1552990 RepID=UPI0022352C5A|nr:MSCRAMM family adhesin SdrC [Halosolutus halophilus]
MVDQDEDELAEAIRELARTIDELRSELDDSRRRSPIRPPAPRLPTPGDLLRLTDEVAVPALLAALEASVRTLEAFQRGLKIVRTEREVRDRVRDRTEIDDASDRAGELRRTTLSQLDTVLGELQRAVSEGALPADEEARDLLSEARELRDDVDRRLRGAGYSGTDRGESIEIDIDSAEDDGDDGSIADDDANSAVDVDVDAELETLKDQYSPADEDPGASDPDTTAADDGIDAAADDEPGGDEPDDDGVSDGADGAAGEESENDGDDET